VPNGERDTRLYIAFAGVIVPPGELAVNYHWAAWVNDGIVRHRIQTLHPNGDLIDPDLVNQPYP
jgi:hypothetical protein